MFKDYEKLNNFLVFRKIKQLIFIIFLCSFLINCLTIAVSFYSMQIFDKVLNSNPAELNPIFKNNFIDILVDPELAVKAPLGLLTEYVNPPLKISFTPITNPDQEVIDEGFHDLEGKNFSILDLTRLYLEKCNYEEEKKTKIYNAIEKLLNKISVQVKEDEDQEY